MNKAVSKRYAKAIFSYWLDKLSANALKDASTHLEQAVQIIETKAEISALWLSSGFTKDEKLKFVDVLKKKNMPDEICSVLSFLVLKKRTEILSDLIVDIKELYYKHTKTLVVTVTSSNILTSVDIEEIKKSVQSLKVTDGLNCEYKFEVKPNILGGIVVRMGQFVYDYSTRATFNQLRRKIENLNPRELVP